MIRMTSSIPTVFVLFLVIHVLAKRSPGVYFDNGMGQSVIEFMDLEDQALLREEMLTLLGLAHDKRGHRVRPADDLDRQTEKAFVKVSHFMMELYNSLTVADSRSGEMKANLSKEDLLNNHFALTDLDLNAINESDVIMSFVNRGHQEELQWTQLFWFDTNEVPAPREEAVIRAELRLYKGNVTDEFDSEQKFVIRCYQLVEGSTSEANLLDHKEIFFGDNGWIILNVTQAVIHWQLDHMANQGLMVEILRKDNTDIQLHPVAVGLATNRERHPDRDAFMVAFFRHTEDDPVLKRYRSKRDTSDAADRRSTRSLNRKRSHRNNRRRRKQHYAHLDEDFRYSDFRDYYDGKHRNRHCQRRMLLVSFRDLGWEDWIIAPEDYEAYYCHGECTFPLNAHMNATNHAIVQKLVHLITPGRVPKPCCAPTKHSAISVLYFDESSNVIIKKYRNMVVKSCGCH